MVPFRAGKTRAHFRRQAPRLFPRPGWMPFPPLATGIARALFGISPRLRYLGQEA